MINILPFDPHHADRVVGLILPIQQSEFQIPISLEAQPDLRDIPAFYQKGHGNFWVALDDQKVVGSAGLRDIGNQAAALRKMFVAATHRGTGQGVAARLLDAVPAPAFCLQTWDHLASAEGAGVEPRVHRGSPILIDTP